MKEKAIIRFSKFLPNAEGHGGEKRSAQLFELFEKANLHVIEFKRRNLKRTFVEKLQYFYKALKIINRAKRFSGIKSTIQEARYIGYDLYNLKHILKDNQSVYEISNFIWEFTWAQYWYIPLIGRQMRLKVIAVPHNLESLVLSQRSHKPKKILSPYWLEEELEYLHYANSIFCISREEHWLVSLKTRPEKVFYLPYNPPIAAQDFLLHIRDERAQRKRHKTVMVLGSAVNPPTLKGMQDLKHHLLDRNDTQIGYDFVGYGVKWILDNNEVLPENFMISESVTNNVLQEKLIHACCILIHQIPSSGALTKIQEMLIAGLPVLVNSMGARSYHNIDGVNVYETFTDLDIYLSDLNTLKTPNLPIINPVFETAFIESLV